MPPPGSPAFVYPTELESRRKHLDDLRIHHLDLGRKVWEVADGSLFVTDLLVGAVMARSYSLVDAFISAFDTWNPVVAAPLLRMQLDSLVRLHYVAAIAPNSDDVALYLLEGGEFRQLEDPDGKRLTDTRLLELAKPAHAWVEPVYRATSGWVHLSPAHVRGAWQLGEEEALPDGTRSIPFFGAIPIRPEQIPLSALQELLGAVNQATEELFGYVELWAARKGLPPGEIR